MINPEDGAIYSPNSSITIIADDTANGQEYLFQLVHIEIIEGLETVGIFYEDTDEEAIKQIHTSTTRARRNWAQHLAGV